MLCCCGVEIVVFGAKMHPCVVEECERLSLVMISASILSAECVGVILAMHLNQV